MEGEGGVYARIEWPARQAEYDAAHRHLLAADARRGAKAFESLLKAVRRGSLEPPAGPAEHALLLEQAASCFAAGLDFDRAEACVDEAERLARSGPDEVRLSSVFRAKAFVLAYRRRFEELAALGQEATAALGRALCAEAEANLRSALAHVHAAREELGLAVRECREAIRASRALPRRVRLRFFGQASAAYALAGRRGRALRLSERCLRIARSLDPPAGEAAAESLHYIGVIRRDAFETDRAVEAFSESYRISRTLGLSRREFACLLSLASVANDAGWYSAALRWSASMRNLRPVGVLLGMAERQHLAACQALGRNGEVRKAAAEIRAELGTRADDPRMLPALAQLAAAAEMDGDLPGARKIAERAVRAIQRLRRDPVEGESLHVRLVEQLLILADIDRKLGDPDRALRSVAQARQVGLRRSHPALRTEADIVEAEVLLAAGKAERARRSASRGWARARAWWNPPQLVRASGVLVRTLAQSGRGASAALRARHGLWLLGWILDKLDPAHRKGFLESPPVSDLVDAARGAGVGDKPESLYSGSPIAPFRYPRLAVLDRAWKILSEEGLLTPERGKKDLILNREREFLSQLLSEHGGSVRACAEALGLHRVSLYQKLKRLGMAPPLR